MADIKSGDVVGVGGVEILSALLTGAAADTDIAVAGLSWAKNPRFFGCYELATAAAIATATDRLSEVVEGSVDGAIQLTDANSTSNELLVFWVQDGSN